MALMLVLFLLVVFGLVVAYAAKNRSRFGWWVPPAIVFMLGYPVKWIVWKGSINSQEFRARNLSELTWVDGDSLSDLLPTMFGAAIVLFVVFVVSFAGRGRPPVGAAFLALPRRFRRWVKIAVIVSLVLLGWRVALGAVMGQSVAGIPFSVRLITNRGSQVVVAVLVAFAGYASRPLARRIIVGWAIPAGLVTIIGTASRGALVKLALPFLFMAWLNPERSGRLLKSIAAISIVTILFYPVISQLRLASISGEPVGLALIGKSYSKGFSSTFRASTNDLVTRVQGLDGIAQVRHNPSQRIGWTSAVIRGSIVKDYTVKVVGIRTANDYRSPGFVAAGMLLAGTGLGVVVGPLIHLFALWVLWAFAGRRRFPVAAKALVLSWALFAFSEGTVQLQDLVALLISAYAVDFVLSRVLQRAPRPRAVDMAGPSPTRIPGVGGYDPRLVP